MTQYNGHAVLMLMEYLHCDKIISFPSFSDEEYVIMVFCQLVELANMYQVIGIGEKVIDNLIQIINEENYGMVQSYANQYHLDTLDKFRTLDNLIFRIDDCHRNRESKNLKLAEIREILSGIRITRRKNSSLKESFPLTKDEMIIDEIASDYKYNIYIVPVSTDHVAHSRYYVYQPVLEIDFNIKFPTMAKYDWKSLFVEYGSKYSSSHIYVPESEEKVVRIKKASDMWYQMINM